MSETGMAAVGVALVLAFIAAVIGLTERAKDDAADMAAVCVSVGGTPTYAAGIYARCK